MKEMIFADTTFIPNEQGDLVALSSQIETATNSLPSGDMGTAVIKMLLTFISLIALIFITYWFLRRLIQSHQQKGSGKQSIAILEKRMLSAKTMLYLIQVEGKQILLAESHLEIKMFNMLRQTEIEDGHY